MTAGSHVADVFAVEQELAREAFRRTLADPDRVHLLDPARIDVAGDQGWATCYVRAHGRRTNELERLGYGRMRFERSTQGWNLVEVDELPTGDPSGPALLVRGIDTGSARPVAPGGDPEAQRLLDEQAIRHVLATYGQTTDAGAGELVGDLYTPDAFVDIEGQVFLHGSSGVADMILGEAHQRLIPWAAHTMGPALVVVAGDRATSTHFGRVYGRRTADLPAGAAVDDHALWRFSVNRWELVRGSDGRWRIDQRIARSPSHPDMAALLARGLAEHHAAAGAGTYDGEVTMAAAACELVTATVLRAAAGAGELLEAVTGARVDWDGEEGFGASSLLAGAAGDDVITHLPAAGAVVVDGDGARVVQPLLSYRPSGGSHVEVAHQAVGSWHLCLAPAGGWEVREVRFRSARRPDATELLAEVVGQQWAPTGASSEDLHDL